MKITLRPGASGGIRNCADLGPSFGAKTGSSDLWLLTDNYGVGHVSLGNGFTCPEQVDRCTFFTGRRLFKINELEVFKICVY